MKGINPPYLLDDSLIPAVQEYIDTHINTDLDLITEHIIQNYPQFASRNFRTFRPSVKKVVDYLQSDTESNSAKHKKKNGTKNLGVRTPKRLQSEEPEVITIGDRAARSSGRKSKPAVEINDFFTIDLEGDSKEDKISTPEVKCVTPKRIIATPKSRTLTGTKRSQISEDDVNNDIEDILKRKKLKKMLFEDYLSHSGDIPSLSSLAGLDYVKKEVEALLRLIKAGGSTCLLVSGVSGVGKTSLVAALSSELKMPMREIRLNKILRSSALSIEKKLQEELLDVFLSGDCVLLISHTDCLWSESSSSRRSDKDAIAETLFNFIDRFHNTLNLRSDSQKSRLVVALECSHPDMMELRLLNCFQRHIALKAPTGSQRILILKELCKGYALSESMDLSLIALKCSGYVAADLVQLVRRAYNIAGDRFRAQKCMTETDSTTELSTTIEIKTEDFMEALKFALPSLKKGFPSIPDKTWDSVGGLEDIREALRQKIVDPIKHPELVAKFNKNASGVLLWGPPGCGKTLLAKAVANEAGINLLIVSGPEVLSMYQGESERAVRLIFARAASVAPCVIFFDEFDSLCPQRSKTSAESGSKSTIVNTLLTEMNGFLERPGVYFMAATNLPSVLDTAVLRPGRFDTLLYVGLPDHQARVGVFKAATKNGTLPALASDVNLESIAKECEGFSGADCHNLVDCASTECWEELRAWRRQGCEDQQLFPEGEYKLYDRHFRAALLKVSPSVTQEELFKYAVQRKQFRAK